MIEKTEYFKKILKTWLTVDITKYYLPRTKATYGSESSMSFFFFSNCSLEIVLCKEIIIDIVQLQFPTPQKAKSWAR